MTRRDLTPPEGSTFRDLDVREIKRGRTVITLRVVGDFAYCRAEAGGRVTRAETRIHLSRLMNPSLYEEVCATDDTQAGPTPEDAHPQKGTGT